MWRNWACFTGICLEKEENHEDPEEGKCTYFLNEAQAFLRSYHFLCQSGYFRILWNPMVYYRVYKNPPRVPVWSRLIQSVLSHFTDRRRILILSSHICIVLPSGIFSPGFLAQNPICTSPLLHTRYMSCSSQASWFDHPNDIWWEVQSIKLLVTYSCPLLWEATVSGGCYKRHASSKGQEWCGLVQPSTYQHGRLYVAKLLMM